MIRLTFHTQARIKVPARLVLSGGIGHIDLAVRFGLLERQGQAPVLIDAGWPEHGKNDGLALWLYRKILRPKIDATKSPTCVLADQKPGALLLSHLHADHLGSVQYWEDVPIHAPAQALDHARRHPLRALRHGIIAGLLPDSVIDLAGDLILPFGLGKGRDVLGDGSVFSVPLPGHADGHTGFLFPDFDPPVLYAADVQWVWTAVAEDRPPRGPARAVYVDGRAAMDSVARLRAFAALGGRVVLCHDPAPVPDFVA